MKCWNNHLIFSNKPDFEEKKDHVGDLLLSMKSVCNLLNNLIGKVDKLLHNLKNTEA